jgi:DNA-directed RNA polymerase subunit RPC12/RpoP
MTAARGRAAPSLTVATNCPNCGAAIDFSEGSNALRCDHCRSQLLVTGHGRVLSYFVAPRVEAAAATSAARRAQEGPGPLRTGEARLFFLPYYRFTATDVRWQRPEPEPPEPPPEPGDGESASSPAVDLLIRRLAERDPDEIECDDRAIERNFTAVALPGLSLYSLGMRPSALRLELYRREPLGAFGHVVGVEMSAETALATGRKTGDGSDIACRAVVGTVLSVVYFPFWFVEIRRPQSRSLTIVDGVSRTVVDRDVDCAILERLGKPAAGEPSVIGLRPLVCPNCGWELPVMPQHVIFYCGSCARAWRIAGDELVEIPHAFAAAPSSGARAPAEHLPFWALRAAVGSEAPQSFLAPAFRYRRARSLVDLTASLSRLAGALSKGSSPPPRAHGGFYDQTDAAALALLAEAGAPPRSFTRAERYRDESIRVDGAELVWLPFVADAYSLRDPFCGAAITRSLLL